MLAVIAVLNVSAADVAEQTRITIAWQIPSMGDANQFAIDLNLNGVGAAQVRPTIRDAAADQLIVMGYDTTRQETVLV